MKKNLSMISHISASSMEHLLGNMATDEDALKYAEYLDENGWELDIKEGSIVVYKDDRYMTDEEWMDTLHACFS